MSACETCEASDFTEYLENVTNVPVSEEEVNNAAVEIMEALQADACVYEKDPVTGDSIVTEAGCSAKAGVFETGGGCTAKFDKTPVFLGNKVTSIGCETVTLNATRYVQTKKTMVNMLSCNCQAVDSNVVFSNMAELTISNSSCAFAELSQSIKGTIKVINQLTEEQEVAIESLMDTFLQSTVDSVIKEVEESTSQTDMKVTTIDQEIVEESIVNTAKMAVSAIKSEILAQNNGKLTISGSTIAGGCKLTQDILLDVIVSNAMSSSIKAILQTETLSQAVSDLSYTFEEQMIPRGRQGDGDLGAAGGIIGGIVCLILLCCLSSLYSKYKKNQ